MAEKLYIQSGAYDILSDVALTVTVNGSLVVTAATTTGTLSAGASNLSSLTVSGATGLNSLSVSALSALTTLTVSGSTTVNDFIVNGALDLAAGPGILGQVLTSAGVSVAPTWENPTFTGLEDVLEPNFIGHANNFVVVNGAANGVVFKEPVLNDLTNVVTSPGSTDLLSYNGSNWVNILASTFATGAEGDLASSALQNLTAISINTLQDVILTAPTTGDFLQRNVSGDWVNVTSNTFLQGLTGESIHDLGDVPVHIPVTHDNKVLRVKATTGGVEFVTLTGSEITDTSTVAGSTVAGAFNILNAARLALSSDDVPNDSVVGAGVGSVTTALDTLNTNIGALGAGVGALGSNDVVSDSILITATTVTNALDVLFNDIVGLNTNQVSNSSSVSGSDVTGALNTLKGHVDDTAAHTTAAELLAHTTTFGEHTTAVINNTTALFGGSGNSMSAVITSIDSAINGKSASGHTHTGSTISALAAADTTSGVFAIARIPTGSSGSTVSFGNHTHTGSTISGLTTGDIISGTFAIGFIPTGTSGSTVSFGNHTHTGSTISALAAADTTSGVFAIARIPTGTTSVTVSLGDHSHGGGGTVTSVNAGNDIVITGTASDPVVNLANIPSVTGITVGSSMINYTGTTAPRLNANAATGVFIISANTSASGANILLNGASATNANDMSFRASGTSRLSWDNSALTWSFNNNNIISVNSITATTFNGNLSGNATTATTAGDADTVDGLHASSFATTSHTHAAGDTTTGIFAIGRIPTGTTGSTVSFGNHTHAGGGTVTSVSGGTGVTVINGTTTPTVSIGQAVGTGNSPTFAALSVNGGDLTNITEITGNKTTTSMRINGGGAGAGANILLFGPSGGSANDIQFKADLNLKLVFDASASSTSGGAWNYNNTAILGVSSITAVGDITAFSDRALKENLEVIDGALGKVCQLSGYTFDRIDIEGGPRKAGLIAQEVEAVLPEVVVIEPDDPNGHKSLAYGNMAALFVEAFKDLKADNDELRVANIELSTRLDGELADLRARLDAAGL